MSSGMEELVLDCITILAHFSQYQSLGDRLNCSFIIMLHKYIICFDLDMYFLIDSNMSTKVVAINKHMHLVKFYNFAVINCKYYNSLKSYIHLKFTAF